MTFLAQLPSDADRGALPVRDSVHVPGPQGHLRPGADLHRAQGCGDRDQDLQEALHSRDQVPAGSGRARGPGL